MKYRCTTKCFIKDSVIMNPGDIVVIEGNKLYNVTTGVDYNDIQYDAMVRACLEEIPNGTQPTVVSIPVIPISKPTDADKFKEITKEMHETFIRKNHDYGNSFEQSLNEEGLAASRIRIGDKWNRFKQLSKGEKAQVNDESLRDTLLDMANYAIMTVLWIDKNGN